jgi:hypothetical protein
LLIWATAIGGIASAAPKAADMTRKKPLVLDVVYFLIPIAASGALSWDNAL